jgi:hypothetical protein
MHTRSLFLLLAVAGVACAHRAAETKAERREERREQAEHREQVERREHQLDRNDWKKLGERTVDGAHDRDVIAVGGHEGTFRRIMLVVDHSAIEVRDVVVTFQDGSHFSPATRLVFAPNSRSGVIDLPGAERVIKNVELRYGNLPGGRRAEVELWAQ